MRVQVPFEDELAVSVDVDMARAVVALPRKEDVILSANLAYSDMIPLVVTDATRRSPRYRRHDVPRPARQIKNYSRDLIPSEGISEAIEPSSEDEAVQ